MKYDLEYHDEINNRRFRVVTKPMTVSDGLACDRLAADMTHRFESYELLSMSWFATVLHGTHTLEIDTGEGDWQPVKLTEDLYLDLPEAFILEWHESVIDKNPHRNQSFENLKKFLEARFLIDNEPTSTEQRPNGKLSELS